MVEFFDKEVASKGWKNVLSEFLPQLFEGLAAGLLHPIIHIGYGLEVENQEVISEGIGFQASHYVSFGKPNKVKLQKRIINMKGF